MVGFQISLHTSQPGLLDLLLYLVQLPLEICLSGRVQSLD